ncbi:DMT family transporter [Aquincola sp. S2]|uniref:DMT family transporter n=1 Tax=Pseudaquabacterium terrae TaxID=2732868 RepID=A0ABX2EAM9_9BURK|nr:DMT family transporter [Aquabacterium terrae]NRF65583.1 DMT family transporter [Aquabacterium terrae]
MEAVHALRRRSTTGRGHALMVAGGLLLGTLGVFVERAGQDPLTTVWFRCAFGALALLGWGAVTGRLHELKLAPAGLAAALGAGGLMIANWALFFAAIERTSIGVATVVFHVQPLWLLLAGAWWRSEPLSPRRLGAALLALAGLAAASGLFDGDAHSAAHDVRYWSGVAMCLGGSLAYAAVTLIAQGARTVGSFALAWWQCVVGALLLAWWPLLHGWPVFGAAWGWLAGLGVLHTGLAYVVLYAGIARLPAGRVALLQFVYPAAAVLIDALAYGRALGGVQALGVLLMGVALASLARGDAARRSG